MPFRMRIGGWANPLNYMASSLTDYFIVIVTDMNQIVLQSLESTSVTASSRTAQMNPRRIKK